MTAALFQWVYELEHFRSNYKALIVDNVSRQFSNLRREPSDSIFSLAYLMNCASVLARSESEGHQEAAYRIAQHGVSFGDEWERQGAALILSALSNEPAVTLATDRGLLPNAFEDQLPLMLLRDRIRHRLENLALSNSGELFAVNRFQKKVWEQVGDVQRLSISAPTSAGKAPL